MGLEVQSLQRTFDILEVVANSVLPVSLKYITDETGLPKSTVYRLLSNLEKRDYVKCDSNGSYRLGIQLLMMSQRAEQNFDIKNLARKYLVHMNEVTKETVHLGILVKNRVLYVDTVESPHALRLVAKLGTTNAVHCTALGKALLVEHDEAQIRELLAVDEMERRTEYTLCTAEDYLAEIAKVRRLGYALDDCESELDGRCIAAPIYDNANQVAAAISISGLASRFSKEHIEKEVARVLLESTREISKALGYSGM
ncbi:Transcriptional regulator KdgR [Sporomusa silvacetica DSM 10669]|uniref:Transcriptional regulator KdgR n=1 Tax=Sporomusa silvacetica DSM 10669 TaxID=1123289 RepID=A0ABZ3IGZ8_9FIRM|nr:IclR family transcriptional regulator [Sporomusa silvacetica]OZC16882.1 transcriptional regulator KdgR [Sporomusa silvacetica DSM 10669]